VLARGHTPQDYSEYLLDIARSVSRSGSRLGIVGMGMPGSLLRERIRILNSGGALPISRTRMAVAVAVCATSSALLASGTLDHARARVERGTSDLAHSSILQKAGTKPEVVPAAAHTREDPRVLLAQATTRTVPSNPTAPASQKAGTAAPPDSAEKERQLEAAFCARIRLRT
jgi:hypothetical protein